MVLWNDLEETRQTVFFSPPSHFFFFANIAKIIDTKNPLVTGVKKHVFSPAGETYLIEFFQVCNCMRSHATNATNVMSHAISQHIILVKVV
jgi:hypothetical protein